MTDNLDIPALIRDLHAGTPTATWIDPAYLIGQAWVESRFNPSANNKTDPGGRKKCGHCGNLYKLTGSHCPKCGVTTHRTYCGAMGLFQFLADTWDEDVLRFHPDFDPWPAGPLGPQQAIRGAMSYWSMIRQALRIHWGSGVEVPVPAVLAAYNWGIGNVRKAMPHGWFGGNAVLPTSTLSYINQIVAKAGEYR